MTREEAKDYIREWCPYDRQEEVIKALSNSCEDCISRQAVLDLINADWKYEGLEIEINNLPSVTPQEQRWIPVSERLPEESLNSVIGWDVYRERCVFVQYIDGYFQITGNNESFDIVAWMPLPQPYREVKE